MPPTLILVARTLGIPFLAGVNLYITVFALGLIKKLTGAAVLGPEFEAFACWPVLIVAGVLAVIEVVADKIPAVDHVWDAIHTFIRTPGAMVVTAIMMHNQEPLWQVLAVLVAGTVAFTAHSGKATLRLGSTKTTAAAANVVVSVAEDVFVAAGSWLAAFHPIILGAIVAVLLVVIAVFGPKIFRSFRITSAFAFNYIRYLYIRVRRWINEDWRPPVRVWPLPAAAAPVTSKDEPISVARVVVGPFGRRRFGWLVVWKDRVTVVVRRGFRNVATSIYFAELEDVYADRYLTMDQLVLVTRGKEHLLSYFKGREPTASDTASLIQARRKT